MSDERPDQQRPDTQMELGVFGKQLGRRLGIAEIGALIFAVFWVLVCAIFLFSRGAGASDGAGLSFVVAIAVVLVPVAVVWLAVSAARSARIVADESAHLQIALNAMRRNVIDAQQAGGLGGTRPEELSRKLEDIAAKQRQTEDTLAVFASTRPHSDDGLPAPAFTHAAAPGRPMRDVSPDAAPDPEAPQAAEPGAGAPSTAEEQPSLALLTPSDTRPGSVAADDLIRAINFPENAEDEAGFDALRRALSDRSVATLIQASQDVLTLLSQDGIYMDDLRPDQARPEIWRHFAGGRRGRAVAALGGIRDRSSLALTAGRMRSDAIFRDAALHFLRQFDQVLTAVAPRLNDEQMARFGATRTARAFMLLGRVTGTFD